MESTLTLTNSFASDVKKGLSSTPKYLSSKYFYDAKGDNLFRQIMEMPEYYLTNCEYEIFNRYSHDFLTLFQNGDQPFRLIEFGAGDGYKTKVLLKHFVTENADFMYSPIDISGNVLSILKNDLKETLPELKVQTLNNEYFKALDTLEKTSTERKVILFLGSNIGNFAIQGAIDFLKRLGQKMTSDDLVMIGFDLKKDPDIILKAYNDPAGITRAFNLNLLDRMNRELNANFNLNNFQHYPTYNPQSGETKSYLVSREQQEVYIGEIDQKFKFGLWEAIDMEISQKYDHECINRIATAAGFKVVRNFMDSRQYFSDTILQKA